MNLLDWLRKLKRVKAILFPDPRIEQLNQKIRLIEQALRICRVAEIDPQKLSPDGEEVIIDFDVQEAIHTYRSHLQKLVAEREIIRAQQLSL